MSDNDLFPSMQKAEQQLAELRVRLEGQHTPGAPRDVTIALDNIESMLRNVQARYDLMCQILDRTSDAIFAKDLHGRYSMINPNGAAMVGKTVAQVLGVDDTALFDRDDANRIIAADREVLRTGESRTREEMFSFDGDQITVLATRTPWYDGDGTLRGLIGTLHEVEHRPRAGDEDALQSRLRSLASEIVISEEQQRRMLAAELHNGLGQDLALAKMQLSALRGSANFELHEPLAGIEALLERADLSVRSITFKLAPPPLYDLGLVPALEWLAEDIADRYGLDVRIADDGAPPVADNRMRVILFRAVRELLINAASHGCAREAVVGLGAEGSLLRVTVNDDGRGFDAVEVNLRGNGLFGIREQLRHVGGSMHIDSAPGRGTSVALTVPIAITSTSA